jgi:hypothetical protein
LAITCTVKLHRPATPADDAGTVPPLSVIVVEPDIADTLPPQLFDINPAGEIVRPDGTVGKLSVTETAVAIVDVLFRISIVSEDVPAGGTFAGEKLLLTSTCALAAADRNIDKLTTKKAAISCIFMCLK